ncbi:hypothetical protein EJ04DRAFT_604462 [Polyplosphaeria fusca]|uniref:Uncharacterized protein n=1 Tax=Polyplosphaeria fusca TaxID=682080 RepID=A0A9P4R864_9PLEO|nr:hypothetical protein EJ04DRAFT_604462 [Polyplosphaeria fusca]
MPRQLPWLIKSSQRKTQLKAHQAVRDDSDDEFFAGTILASSGKGKGKGKQRADSPPDSDQDELPELPFISSPHEGKSKDSDPNLRAPSSSPPPRDAELSPPNVEYMRKGISKFDLRDDEWMMVEDEFLRTAKLFTRHLHLEAYERIKKDNDEARQKREAEQEQEQDRPVVPHSKPSVESMMKQKADAQLKAQKKALRDVMTKPEPPKRSSTVPSSKPDPGAPPKRAGTDSIFSRPAQDLDTDDEDDLDAPPRPSYSRTPSAPTPTFAKPAIPPKSQPSATPTSRPIRKSAFELFDDWTPSKPSSPPAKSAHTSPFTSRAMPTRTSPSKTPAPASNQPSSNPPNESDSQSQDRSPQAERFTKRKVEREKEAEREKRKSVKLEDIPTFLY